MPRKKKTDSALETENTETAAESTANESVSDDALESNDAVTDNAEKISSTDTEEHAPSENSTDEPNEAYSMLADVSPTPAVTTPAKPARQRIPRKKSILDLNLNELDRNLSEEERREWSAIYASFRSKSILSGTVIGVDTNTFDVMNIETKQVERTTLSSLAIIDHRVKVLIPETEMWMPGTERPPYVLRNMVGGKLDYVIMEIDREGECAIGSRRVALAAKRHFFAKSLKSHREGELIKCRIAATGAKRCTIECNGYDIEFSQRDLSYTAIADLREHYRPGQELDCLYKGFDPESDTILISAKEAKPNPFIGAENRHPVGSRRHATISGKYAGGVFCTLPDDTVCMCLYSTQHSDMDFSLGDQVIIVIRQYNYDRQLIFGRILSKW